MAEFEFLRPHWLWALGLIPALLGWRWLRVGDDSPWRAYGDPEILESALIPLRGGGWSGWVIALVVGLLGVIALAGPSWERSLTTGVRPAHTRVLVLDLSRSMDARDVAPSRLGLALHKARQILERSQGLQVGMTVFAGASFNVAPMTTDASTILHHLDVMATNLIPVQGSRPDLGLDDALRLLRQGGALTGDVVLISDGYRGDKAAAEAARLLDNGFPVSVLGVGTAEPTVIPTGEGEPLRGLSGVVVKVPAYLERLRAIAKSGGGGYATASESADDLDTVLLSPERWKLTVSDPDRRLSVPKDRGPWLIVLLVPLAAFAFRRGWLLILPLLLALPPEPANAAWYEWFRGGDYHAAKALRNGDPETAVRLARDPMIAGAAFYQLEQYALAAAAFAESPSAMAHYNRGNALAHLGKVRAAIAAYDRALAFDPGLVDARLNQAVLARLLPPDPDSAPREQSAGGEMQRGPGPSSQARADHPNRQGQPASSPWAGRSGSNSIGSGATPLPNSQHADEFSTAGRRADGKRDVPIAPRAEQRAREFGGRGEEAIPEHEVGRWLARIPDDPGSLLRQKFRIEFETRRWQRSQITDSW